MANPNPETGSTLNGLFKTVFADTLEHAVPEDTTLQTDIKFKEKKKIGDSYTQPVRLRRSGGQTYATGPNALTGFLLNDPVPGQMANAQIVSQAYVKRNQVAYFTDFRSQTSQAAFAEAFEETVMDAKEGAHFDLERNLMYGQSTTGSGVVETVVPAGVNATITISALTWGAGLFTQAEGQLYQVWDAALLVNRTITGPAVLTGLDVDSRGFTLVTALAGDAASIAPTDVLIPFGEYNGAGSWNTMVGLDRILTNSGLLFNINAATFGLWRANTYSAGNAPLTMTKLGNACIKALVKGGRGKVNAYISPWAWSDINNDTAGLRRFTESMRSEVELGTQRLKFYGPSGEITITAHINVKAGEAFVTQPDRFLRVGSSEPVFGSPGEDGERKFLLALPNNAAYEFRLAWDQALFCTAPARQTKITNIVNSSGP